MRSIDLLKARESVVAVDLVRVKSLLVFFSLFNLLVDYLLLAVLYISTANCIYTFSLMLGLKLSQHFIVLFTMEYRQLMYSYDQGMRWGKSHLGIRCFSYVRISTARIVLVVKTYLLTKSQGWELDWRRLHHNSWWAMQGSYDPQLSISESSIENRMRNRCWEPKVKARQLCRTLFLLDLPPWNIPVSRFIPLALSDAMEECCHWAWILRGFWFYSTIYKSSPLKIFSSCHIAHAVFTPLRRASLVLRLRCGSRCLLCLLKYMTPDSPLQMNQALLQRKNKKGSKSLWTLIYPKNISLEYLQETDL